MAKEVNGYKIVRVKKQDGHEQLLSAMVHDPNWIVAYVPGIPTYPRGGSALFGFDSLAHAQQFVRLRNGRRMVQLWEARLGHPKLCKRLARWTYNYLRFWSGKRDNTFQAPVGTMACEFITLLKQVV
ncbi:hypothetical protein LCGC14_0896610 [marine sediment metagenome]|uniref:Uncharacterized protein n=1 Tax=marine sediment metagenome TaxID=412755 RepID=A0A0F9S4N4_9ZZZZ